MLEPAAMLLRPFATPLAVSVLAAVAVPGTASADPTTPSEPKVDWPREGYMPNYPSERPADRGSPKTGCGTVEYSLTQERRLDGRWGDYASSVLPDSETPTSCTFPKQGKKWASLQAAAKKQANRWAKLEKGEVVIIPNDSSWSPMTSSGGGVHRGIRFLVYRKNLQLGFERTACGETDPKIVCEASGSKTVLALNQMRWLLAVAKEALPKKNLEGCKDYAKWAFAWSKGVPKFRDSGRAAKTWAEGLTYKTRYDGTLAESRIFERIAAVGAEAERVFKMCGGKDLTTSESEEMSFKSR